MRIYLIGMPLCGKSLIAQKYSEKYGLKYIDLDYEIEKENMYFIEDIYNGFGEKTFRIIEEKALNQLSNENNFIMACGEGIVDSKNNLKYLQNGIVIFINVSYKALAKRFIDNPRPIFNRISLRSLYEERQEKYLKFCNIELKIEDDNNHIDYIVKKINEVVINEKKDISN